MLWESFVVYNYKTTQSFRHIAGITLIDRSLLYNVTDRSCSAFLLLLKPQPQYITESH